MSTAVYAWGENRMVFKDICFECGSKESIHYHHIIPEVMGGKQTIPLCEECHGKVHDRTFTKHRELQRIGIERAKLEGKFQGRKVNSVEPVEKYLEKEKTKGIINLYMIGTSVREIQRTLKCSSNSVYKAIRTYNRYYEIDIKDLVQKPEEHFKITSRIPSRSKKFELDDWMKEI